jgi:undecaprenyl diphosphate synthase
MSIKDRQIATAERLDIPLEKIPRSLAIIMDGNGRWAQERSLSRAEGHIEGAKTAEKIALTCARLGIESLTLYSFSIENWKRPADEVKALMSLYEEYLISMRPMLARENVRLIHLGRTAQLPASVCAELQKTMTETAKNHGMVFGFALNYGGRSEIVDATRAIAQKCLRGELSIKDIDSACISQHLYTATISDPDLVIRTANELRISNFLLWQISYSEFYVAKTYWPDFSDEDLDQAILAYARRDRRYGDLTPTKPSTGVGSAAP